MKDRELDALVAEKVMGYTLDGDHSVGYQDEKVRHWKIRVCDVGEYQFAYKEFLPSKRIKDAWAVMEKVVGDQYEYTFELERLTGRTAPGRWWAYFRKGLDCFSGHAEDAPRAICLAALNAVGVPA
jgi:hypothetical protein